MKTDIYIYKLYPAEEKEELYEDYPIKLNWRLSIFTIRNKVYLYLLSVINRSRNKRIGIGHIIATFYYIILITCISYVTTGDLLGNYSC